MAVTPVPSDSGVLTGIRRLSGDSAAQDLKAEYPGLQSVTLTVVTGPVAVTMSNGTGVTVPAGMTLTWSVLDSDDSALAAAAFDGGASSEYFLNWTYKAGVAG